MARTSKVNHKQVKTSINLISNLCNIVRLIVIRQEILVMIKKS
jgi:hypothetical protein